MSIKTFLLHFLALVWLIEVSAIGGEATEQSKDSARGEIGNLLKRAYTLTFGSGPLALDSGLQLSDSACRLAVDYYGPNDTLVARSYLQMAFANYMKTGYDSAVTLLKQAIGIYQVNFGNNCLQQVIVLRVLGDTYYYGQRRFAEGEASYRRGIELLEDAPEFSPETFGLLYNNLAGLYQGMGQFDEAESCYVRALDIWSTHYGDTSYQVSTVLINLGKFLSQTQEKYAEAVSYLRKALNNYEEHPDPRNFCPTCPSLAKLWLANALYGLGKDEEARTELDMAVLERIAFRGLSNFETASMLESAALVEQGYGHWQRAIAFREQCLDIRRSCNDRDSAGLGQIQLNLGRCLLAVGEVGKGLAAFEFGFRTRVAFLKHELSRASESTKLRFVGKYSPIVGDLLTLATTHPADQSTKLSLDMVLTGKGMVLDALAEEREAASCSGDSSSKHLLSRYADICNMIAKSALESSPNSARANGYYAAKDSVELELSRACSQFTVSRDSLLVSPDDVSRSLPGNAILWEMVQYRPIDFHHIDSAVPARYLAFTLDPKGRSTVTDLGDARIIDSLVTVLHEEVQKGAGVLVGDDERQLEESLSRVSSQLSAFVLQPLLAKFQGGDRILVSPDGQLSLLPFEILPLSDGRYAVEQYEFSYLSSGRDVLKHEEDKTNSSSGAVVVAAPDFESEAASPLAQFSRDSDTVSFVQFRGPSDRSECLSVPFDPLPASEKEGRLVSDLLQARMRDEVVLLTGPAASEDSLKHLSHPPRVLHMATHGYFCSKASYSNISQMTESPLLYSGLALAGSNRTIENPDNTAGMTQDGILTALEVSGLNLMGTDLVVLGSCRAGMGPVLQGEGVYGLRRAFQLAGVRSIIMSMFDVPDMTARDLMARFYTEWLSGTSKSTALRKAMLAELRQRRQQHGAAHPLFWGGFVLTGDPN